MSSELVCSERKWNSNALSLTVTCSKAIFLCNAVLLLAEHEAAQITDIIQA